MLCQDYRIFDVYYKLSVYKLSGSVYVFKVATESEQYLVFGKSGMNRNLNITKDKTTKDKTECVVFQQRDNRIYESFMDAKKNNCNIWF